MKTIISTHFTSAFWSCHFGIFFSLALLSQATQTQVQAQKRGADLIITIKKDTLLTKITEVGLTSLTFKNWEGDTTTRRTIAKIDIRKVIFGNGDVEEFGQSNYTQIAPKRHNKQIPATPFQREITAWSTDKLLEKKAFYKQGYPAQQVVGITAVSVGGGFLLVGLLQTFLSAITSVGPEGPKRIAIGMGVAGGIGVPLMFLGNRNKRKHKAIEKELLIRGL